MRVPRADGIVSIVEHAHELERQRSDIAGFGGESTPLSGPLVLSFARRPQNQYVHS